MTSEADARAALEAVPGWAGAKLARLPGGETNSPWLVEKDGKRAVLKVDPSPRGAPYAGRRAEASVQSLAAQHDLAAQVLYSDETVLLAEYAEGQPWRAADADEPDSIAVLAAALRQLHSLPLTGRVFDAPAAAAGYVERLGDADPAIAERCLRRVREAPSPAKLCVCHNDLVPGNILVADRVRFIDFEFACDNDPLFDLAAIVVEHRLSTGSASLLLDAYFEGDGERWHEPLVAQARLYEALAWLWRESRSRI